MTSVEIEKRIAALQEQENQLKEGLNTVMMKAQAEMMPHCEQWIKRQVDSSIQKSPDTVLALGKERLQSLKLEVNKLLARLPDIERDAIYPTTKWPHNQAPPKDRYSESPGKDFFNTAFRDVVSQVGKVLNDYGLITSERHSPWERGRDQQFRYSISTGFDARTCPSINSYFQLHKQFRAVEQSRIEALAALATAKATELWESA